MAVDHNRILIVGCGPGAPEYVAPSAREAVAEAHCVMGSQRLLKLFPESGTQSVLPAAVEPAMREIAEQLQVGSVAVLVSGDPGLFSLAKSITSRFGRDNCRIVPAVSSVQVAFAKLGLDWTDARIISAHGRIPKLSAEELSGADKIAVLAGTEQAVSWVSRVAEELAKSHVLFACENLTLPNENVRKISPDVLRSARFASLSLIILVRHSVIFEEHPCSDTTEV